MSNELITEDQLKKRLRKTGRKKAEIERLITQHAEASSQEYLDIQAIAEILKKTQEDSILRVKGFNLTREQYDALVNYYEEKNGNLVPGQPVDAKLLVQKVLEEFIELLS